MILFLKCSGRWGRIKAEITCAMTSRYAIALYELVQLRSGLEKSLETVTIDRFRELLSVPPGKYDRVDNLMRKAIEPVVLQVNGLSDMGVMFLTMPISWRGTLAQYAGRLHRLHASKRDVVIYDYVDENEPLLAKMASKREVGYRMGIGRSSGGRPHGIACHTWHGGQSFSEVGMARQASRALHDSEWMLVRAISLGLSDDVPPPGA